MGQPRLKMRSDEKPLYVGCGIKESRLPRVMKISSVNEQLGNAESARIAPRQEAVDDDVGDEQNNRSANDPALNGPNKVYTESFRLIPL
jgi:hypothetical protein